jgi:hypothetical protein
LPGPANEAPAIQAIDASHAIVAFSLGGDPTDTGTANSSTLAVAVLDVAAVGQVTATTVGAILGPAQLGQSQPTLAMVGGQGFLGWHTDAAPGDVLGEEIYVKQVGFGPSGLDLSTQVIPLPRWPAARAGDQRLPVLAGGPQTFVAAWTDLGKAIATSDGGP